MLNFIPARGLLQGTPRAGAVVLALIALFFVPQSALQAQVVRTGYTAVVASNSAKCLDLAGESTSAGTGAVQFACNSSANQQWTVQNFNSSFRLIQQRTGGCLVISGGSTTPGAALVEQPCSGTTSELWSFAPSGSSFQIVSKLSGLCASVSSGSQTDSATIVQQACSTASNFLWTFSSGLFTSSSLTVLQAAHSGQCLEVSGASGSAGAAIDQNPCNAATSQQWTLAPSGSYFELIAQNSALCASNAGATSDGSAITQAACSSSAASGDLFTLTPVGGSYELVAANSGLCLTVPGASQAPATALTQSACSTVSMNQMWSLSAAALPSSWTGVTPLAVDPIAVANQPNGDLIMWSANDQYSYQSDIGYNPGQTYTSVFNPATMTSNGPIITTVGYDMFCPGTANLFNGNILVNGGDSSAGTSIYNPATQIWAGDANMNIERGYQGDTVLTNGSVLTLGGSWSGDHGDKTAEVWTQGVGWTVLPGVPETPIIGPDPAGVYRGDNHLWLFAAPNGLVFHAGPSAEMHWIDPTGTGTITSAGNRGDDAYSINGKAVLYDVGKIMKTGGAPGYDASNAEANTYVIDINNGVNGVTVTKTAPMAYPRAFANGVVLPNGQVVIIGGQTYAQTFSDATAILTPEIWDPQTNVFRQLKAMQTPRVYHSTAILLSDGRVFEGGGGQCGSGCSANHFDTEILTPPYLLNADGSPATRPVINSASSSVTLGGTISATTTSPVASFVLMRLSSVTHTVNNDQRRIPLQMQYANGTSYILTVPSNPGIVLPGNYWLFALDARGVPSVAANVLVSPPSVAGFSIGASKPSLLVMQGAGVGVTITEAPQNGFSGSVTLSASGLPSGVTANFSSNPTTGSSVLTFNASASAAPGAYNITITGTANTITASTNLSLVVGTTNCTPTATTPYVQVGTGGWQQTAATTVTTGSIVAIGPQPAGTWFWSGPGGFTSIQREVHGLPLNAGSNTFVGQFVNPNFCVSTQNIVITVGSGPGSFTLSPSAQAMSVLAGGSGNDTISVTPSGGFTGSVTLSASGLPAGVTASFSNNPTTASSEVTFTAASSATPGTSTVTISGTSGSVSAATTISLTVTSGSGFTLTSSAGTVPVNQGSSASDTISVTRVGGFNGSVTLSASGLPTGVAASFGTNPTTGSSQLTLTAATSAIPGSYKVSVSGASNGLTASTSLTLLVGNNSCTPTPITPYLQVNGAAWQQTTTATVAAGSVVNLGPQPGGNYTWNGPGGFSSSQREIDGIPLTAGSNTYTAIYFDGNSCITTENFVITEGSGGGASFSLSSSAPNLTVPVGGSGTDTISITPSGGFSGSVTLSASGLPAGVTASFGTNPATTSSVVTFAAANSAAAGTYNVTVSGVSSSLTASTGISLTVGGSGCTTTLTPYMQVNGGAWQQAGTASVATTGTTVNLGPQPSVWGGSWSWSGPGGFTSNQREIDGIPLTAGSNTFVASYVDPSGCTGTLTYVITVGSGGGASFTLSSSAPNLTVPVGGSGTDTISITPSGGFTGSVTLSASGLPTGVTASFATNPATTSSVLTLAAANSATAGTYKVTVNGVSNSLTASTQITLTVGSSSCSTTLMPYMQVNGGTWQQTGTATVATGSTVNLGPQPSVWGGGWSWSGPGGFTSNQREIDGIPLSAGSNTFVASYVDPSGCTSTLTYVITVGSGGSPSFTLSSSAPNLTVPVGSSGTDTISITPSGGFSGSVTLSASGLPTGVTASFGTNPATASSVLTFTAASSATAGTYNVTVSGVSASLTASTQIGLTIGSSGCTPTALTPYMQVNGGAWQQASTASVAAGSTVNIGPQPAVWGGSWSWSGPGGFTSNQREIDGIPLSAGSNTFVATYVNPSGCTSTQNFVITVGSGGGASFTLSASAPSLTVPVGSSGTDTISITPSGGFTGSVTLSASGLPSGVTASFGTNPATTSSVLTLTAANSAAAGTYNVTVTGVSSSLTASTQISLTIGSSGGCTPTTLTPYLQVNSGAWQQTANASVTAGSTVNLGPQPAVWGGGWSWTGPGGFTSTQREIDGIPLAAGSNTFVGTYVDPNSCSSKVTYVITE